MDSRLFYRTCFELAVAFVVTWLSVPSAFPEPPGICGEVARHARAASYRRGGGRGPPQSITNAGGSTEGLRALSVIRSVTIMILSDHLVSPESDTTFICGQMQNKTFSGKC